MANRTRVLTYPIRLNLSSTYEAPAMIFYAPLDPTRLYNLTLSPDTLSASSIALHSLTYYSGLWSVPMAVIMSLGALGVTNDTTGMAPRRQRATARPPIKPLPNQPKLVLAPLLEA